MSSASSLSAKISSGVFGILLPDSHHPLWDGGFDLWALMSICVVQSNRIFAASSAHEVHDLSFAVDGAGTHRWLESLVSFAEICDAPELPFSGDKQLPHQLMDVAQFGTQITRFPNMGGFPYSGATIPIACGLI